MDDPEGVRLGDGLAGLEHVPDGFLARQRAARSDEGREIPSLEVLHHDERRAVLERADVEDPRNVLAFELGRCARLARESCDESGALEHLRKEKLESDRAIEKDLRGGDHDAHTTGAERPLDAVFPAHEVSGVHRTDFFGQEHSSLAIRVLTEPRLRTKCNSRRVAPTCNQ
jgi:hypothetical protein